MSTKKSGAELIAAERQRQISQEGWTSDHDAGHDAGQLAHAGACYSRHAAMQVDSDDVHLDQRKPALWPWESEWWKPSEDPIRNLVKAGALIAAEIDRLQRIES